MISTSEGVRDLLTVHGLKTYFTLDEGLLRAVDGVGFEISKGATLGLVGESGCGKSVTALSILRIVPPFASVEGQILFRADGQSDGGRIIDLAQLDASGRAMRSIRGKDITMVFQEPMTSFSPLHTIGDQIMEAILLHRTRHRKEARDIAMQMIGKVGIPNPKQRIDQYPHQLSGGMRQRAMIAMALSCNPSLLIADEPTTALDVTVQAQVLDLMQNLKAEYGMAMLYITHDLGVIAEIADRVAVMYLGRIVEMGSTDAIFHNPLHPYTKALLASVPRIGKSDERLESIKGTVPVPINLPTRCGFAGRCTRMCGRRCVTEIPEITDEGDDHLVRCFLYQ